MTDDDLKIIRDEAYTPHELEVRERERARNRERNRRRRQDPEYAAAQYAAHRRYVERNREKVRAYHRDWMRKRREELYQERERLAGKPVASLHGLTCPYPKGCTCRPILVVEPWQ